jgi:hypothetical protein
VTVRKSSLKWWTMRAHIQSWGHNHVRPEYVA